METATKNDVRDIIRAEVPPLVEEIVARVVSEVVGGLTTLISQKFEQVDEDLLEIKSNTLQLSKVIRDHSADIAELKARPY